MPRSTKRASQTTLNTIHRLVGEEVARQFRKAKRAKEPVSAAFMAQAVAYLKMAETTDPEREIDKRKNERLKETLRGFVEYEAGTALPDSVRGNQVPSGDPYANLGNARE